MSECCKSDCHDDITISRFSSIRRELLEKKVPYTVDKNYIMICSPVGNQGKYTQRKADIVLSGYSTAPSAALKYIKDSSEESLRLCKHSFGTCRMQTGIKKILDSIGVNNSESIIGSALSEEFNPNINFLFTQMLCMISNNGSAKAHYVAKILRESDKIKKQACFSIQAWYSRIKRCLKENGIILLMGNNAEELIKNTYMNADGTVQIDFSDRISSNRLLDEIKKYYKIYFSIHASGIAYRENEKRWKESNKARDK